MHIRIECLTDDSFIGNLPTSLQLKKLVPVMITVNSATKRYKENDKIIVSNSLNLLQLLFIYKQTNQN